jgi:hypothetical protein
MSTTFKPATDMSAQHTPGPWFINPRGFIVDSSGAIVTRMEGSEDSGNARLIAAAPDLLALARWSCAYANGWNPTKQEREQHHFNCLAIIGNATGGAKT